MISTCSWTGLPAPSFARLWYAMLEECDLLGSGVVDDWETRLNEHFVRQMKAGLLRWFVADDDGEIVGTCGTFLSGGRSNILKDTTATLAGIYIVPGYRNRGLARELTVRAIDWCKANGVKTIRLHASSAGRPLYESLGFVTASENMRLDLR